MRKQMVVLHRYNLATSRVTFAVLYIKEDLQLQNKNKIKPSLPLDRGWTERENERTLGPGTAIRNIHRGYLEVSLRLLLLCSQLWERVLQRLRLGRVKLPLLLQHSGPLLILLHPGARHSKGRQPFPPQHSSQEGRGSVSRRGVLNYLAALSKEALTGALSVFHFNNTDVAGESQVDSSWMEHSQPPDEVQEHQPLLMDKSMNAKWIHVPNSWFERSKPKQQQVQLPCLTLSPLKHL